MEPSKENLIAALEGLLFIYGEPLTLEKAAKFLEIKLNDLEAAATDLENKLKENSRGLQLSRVKNQIQLTTKPDFQKLGEKIIKEEIRENLTPAALETLAIVAYAGPLSRALVDYLRGVNSGYILRNLLVRGLIERQPDPQRPYVFLYNVSFDFLKHLGLTKQGDLPEYSQYQEVLKKINVAS